MNILTTCPGCNTVFRVPAEILAAREGQVRCGVCSCVFDAREYLTPEVYPSLPSDTLHPEPGISPEVESPASPDEQPEAFAISSPETGGATTPAQEITSPVEEPEEPLQDPKPLIETPIEAIVETPVDEVEVVEPPIAEQPKELAPPSLPPDSATHTTRLLRRKRIRAVLLGIGSGVLGLLLAAQLVYVMRTPIAARIPAVKPWLVAACTVVGCHVALPRDADAIKISSSDLLSDPAHPSRIQVSLLIANDAGYAEAYPHIELTLTDTHDAPLARRIFAPAEYLHTPDKAATGIKPGTEASVDLLLDIGNLAATGYRVLVFYP